MDAGAGGHLGRKLFDHLENQADLTVSGLDIRPVDHPAIFTADFAAEPSWAEHLKGVDVIVHLAGDREPGASWPSSIRNNMDATLAIKPWKGASNGWSSQAQTGFTVTRGSPQSP